VRADLALAFGQVIQRLREDRGWSQEQLAEHSDRSRNLIGRFEQGRSQPTLESLWDVAQALEAKPSELIRLAEEQLARNRRSRSAPRRRPGRPRSS
jgi:transcriptional regulator with XRE-family HTH domain